MVADRYLALIRTVAECRVLTTGQFAALEFGSEQAARRAVRAMVSQELLHVGYDRLGRQRGRPEQLLSLKPAAVQALKDAGILTKDADPEDAQARYMALAHSVVVRKHAGTLRFQTECGKGTTFLVRLPLKARPAAANEQAA